MTFVVPTIQRVAVKYLRAICDVRYWEDAVVNGVKDEDGTLIPLRSSDVWYIIIDLETGIIRGWPKGTVASVHYKVCDAGSYSLLDAGDHVVVNEEGYVPKMLCPKDNGYGDYIIMDIEADGKIKDWKVNLDYFKPEIDD